MFFLVAMPSVCAWRSWRRLRNECHVSRDAPLRGGGVSCLAPPLRSGAKQLGALPLSRAYVVQLEPAWCLRYAPAPNWHLYSGTSSHSAVLGVELAQIAEEEKLHTNIAPYWWRPTPGPQPDGYRAIARHRRLGPSALADSLEGEFTSMPTSLDLTKEEFLVLRSEGDAQVAETRRLEIAVVGGAAAIYAWLATHQPLYGIGPWAWLLPVLLPIYGGLRSYAIYRRISDISAYLKQIEDNLPETQRLLRGWENFLAFREKYLAKTAKLFWITLFLICSVLSTTGVVGQF